MNLSQGVAEHKCTRLLPKNEKLMRRSNILPCPRPQLLQAPDHRTTSSTTAKMKTSSSALLLLLVAVAVGKQVASFVLPSSSSFAASSGIVAARGPLSSSPLVAPLNVVITPDGSPSMQEYRKKVLQDLVERKNNGELDGYQLFDMIVAKWGVPYGVELRRLDFAGKKLLYINVMWKYLGQQSFPLSERQYLEHLVRCFFGVGRGGGEGW